MSAGKFKLYDAAKFLIADTTLNLDDPADWKIALFTSFSNADTLTNSEYGDLSMEHAAISNYITGGAALTGVTWTNNAGVITFDASNPQWNVVGGSIVCKYAVIYKDATVNGIEKPLLAVAILNLLDDVTIPDGSPLIISFNSSGIFSLSGGNIN